jgi:hypothetical protein
MWLLCTIQLIGLVNFSSLEDMNEAVDAKIGRHPCAWHMTYVEMCMCHDTCEVRAIIRTYTTNKL